ncbi:MAG TPA: hypothetical protein VJG90_08350 [Candidatus Nanoarchaeia archaeon]|nr:hypothetical protein [Candidatus Nanoarchaeia archaeon]
MSFADGLAKRRADVAAQLTRLDELAAKITPYQTRSEELSKLFDHQLRVRNANERVLSHDPVYNAPDASEALKEAIRTRTLNGFTAERLEDEYKCVLYGISAENKNRLVLVSDAEGNPTQFDAGFLRRTGCSNRELANLCLHSGLDEAALLKLYDYETIYGISFKPLANLLSKGYSVSDVEILLQVSQTLLAKDSRVSLDMVVRFREKFKGMETEAGLADWISLAHDGLNLGSIDASVTRLLDKATELRTDDFDTALEAAKQPDPKRPPWG